MSNHVHTVLFVDPDRTRHWADEEVIERWRSAYRWRNPADATPPPTPAQVRPARLAAWRERLGSVSWFMKSLNEPLAHIANAEDACRGHFWQGRFGCTALLDDPAVLAAMAYVDLNPIKAALAESLSTSDFTSIQRRLRELCRPTTKGGKADADDHGYLHPTNDFTTKPVSAVFSTVPPSGPTQTPGATLCGYLALVEAAAEAQLTGKPNVNSQAQQALNPLSLAVPQWCQAVADFERLFRRVAGTTLAVDAFIKKIGRRRRIDVAGARLLSTPQKAT